MVLPSLKRGKAFRAAMAEKFFQHGKVVFIPEDGRAVGFAAFCCNDHVERKGYLSMIAVYPDMQGKGCGKELLTYVEHTAKIAGCVPYGWKFQRQTVRPGVFIEKRVCSGGNAARKHDLRQKLENASDEWTEDTHDV